MIEATMKICLTVRDACQHIQPLWRDEAFWTALAAVAALLTVIIAFYSTWQTTRNANKLTATVAVREQLIIYTAAHANLINAVAALPVRLTNPFSDLTYQVMPGNLRNSTQIVAGQLVMVVDFMEAAGDDRFDLWASFISSLEGPLRDKTFRLEAYASQVKTLAAIDSAKRAAAGDLAL